MGKWFYIVGPFLKQTKNQEQSQFYKTAFAKVSKKFFLNLNSPRPCGHARALLCWEQQKCSLEEKNLSSKVWHWNVLRGPSSDHIRDQKFSRQNLTICCHDRVISAESKMILLLMPNYPLRNSQQADEPNWKYFNLGVWIPLCPVPHIQLPWSSLIHPLHNLVSC